LEYLFLRKVWMFTVLFIKDDTYIKRNRKYIRQILLLINPKWVDPDETSHMFKYAPRGVPLPMTSPDEIEAANKDAVARFQETNASFSNFVIDRADTIRARMAAMPDEFPALSATKTSSPAGLTRLRGMRITATPRGLAGRGRSVAHPAEKTITANSSLRRGEPQRCANLLPSDCLPRQGIVPPNEDITLEPNRAFIDRGGLSPFFG